MEDGRGDAEPMICVLGPCTVLGRDIPLSPAQRTLLSRLALGGSTPVSLEQLAECLWDRPPVTATATIRNQISRLRRILSDEAIATTPWGYLLRAPLDVDLVRLAPARLEQLLAQGLADQGLAEATRALERWTGVPFADLDRLADIAVERQRLAGLHEELQQWQVRCALEAGKPGLALRLAKSLVAEHPAGEGQIVLLARSLAAAGHRGEALAELSRAKRDLRERFGLSPGAELNALEQSLLTAEDTSPAGGRRPFVGRDDLVNDIVLRTKAGRETFLFGPNGIGLTCLLEEVRRRLTGAGWRTVLVTGGQHRESAIAVLAEVLDELGASVPAAAGVFGGFVGAVGEAARIRPVAILVDDADGLGPSVVAALQAVAQVPNVSVVRAGHSPDAEPEDAANQLSVDPLTVSAVAELLTVIAPDQADQATRIWTWSGGHPLTLTLLLSGDDQSTAHQEEAGFVLPTNWDHSLPPNGFAVLGRRLLNTLDSRQRVLVETAAVAGDGAPAEWVIEVAAVRIDLPANVLARRGVGIWFHHAALRGQVLAALTLGQRQDLQLALGRAAVSRALPSATAADHLLAAADLAPQEAVAAARNAAAEATRNGAHRDAADWYRRAGAAAGPLSAHDRLSLRIEEGDALRLAGDPSHVGVLQDCVAQALAAGDPELLAQASYAFFQLGGATGIESPVFDGLVEQALAELQRHGQQGPALAAASLATSLAGDFSRTRALFDEADALTTGPARAKVLPFAYLALGHPTDLERREAAAAELAGWGATLDDPVSLSEAAHLELSLALHRGDGDRARTAIARLADLVDRTGDVGRRWQLHYCLAAVSFLDAQLDEAELLAGQAFSLFHEVNPARAMVAYVGQLVPIRVAQGRAAELVDLVEPILSAGTGPRALHAVAATGWAERGGKEAADQVRTHVRLTLETAPPDFTWLAAQATAGSALATAVGAAPTTDDVVMLDELIGRLQPWSGRTCWQGTCSYGPVDTALWRLWLARGDAAAAAEHLDRARRVVEQFRAPVFAAELPPR